MSLREEAVKAYLRETSVDEGVLSREWRATAEDARSDAGMTSSTAERDGEVTLDSVHRMLLLLVNENATLRARVEKQGSTILNLSEINSRTMLSNQRLIDEVTGLKGELKTALEQVEAQRQAALKAEEKAAKAEGRSEAALSEAHDAKHEVTEVKAEVALAKTDAEEAKASARATEAMATKAQEASARAESSAQKVESWAGRFSYWAEMHTHKGDGMRGDCGDFSNTRGNVVIRSNTGAATTQPPKLG